MIDVFMKSAMNKVYCEDYVVGKSSDSVEYAIISDGCSSSPDTHLGSQALTFALEDRIHEEGIPSKLTKEFYRSISYDACCTSPYIQNKRNLDATLLLLHTDKDNLYVNMCGDGVYFYKLKGIDSIFITEIEFDGNMPLYASYYMEDSLTKKRESLNLKSYMTYSILNGDDFKSASKVESVDKPSYITLSKDLLEFCGIASDGIQSFSKKDQSQVYKDFLRFRGKGNFIKRLAVHNFKNYAREGVFNTDDFSIAIWRNDN